MNKVFHFSEPYLILKPIGKKKDSQSSLAAVVDDGNFAAQDGMKLLENLSPSLLIWSPP